MSGLSPISLNTTDSVEITAPTGGLPGRSVTHVEWAGESEHSALTCHTRGSGPMTQGR
jgi:hypothetical protein